MLVLISAAALVAAPVLVAASDSVSVAGKWHVHDSIAGNDSDADCTFERKMQILPELARLTRGL